MSHKRENLKELIKLIKDISNKPENFWFKDELIRDLTTNPAYLLTEITLNDIKINTNKVVKYLEVEPECSVDYSFIGHELLRKRLDVDNLRMENIRFNLKERDEMKRLYDFCINAFYQVENLINYYYYEKFPDFKAFIDHLECIEGTKFILRAETNIGDVTIATKIYSFNRTHYKGLNAQTGFNIDNLRLIRNEGLHRFTRIKNIENENQRLHQFLKHATFDSIHSLVAALADKIKTLLKS